jgi:hypothetical protein
MVIDRSGSMSSSNRLSLTIQAVKTVLTTLTVNDYVAIVAFDDIGEQLCEAEHVVQTEAEAEYTKQHGRVRPRGVRCNHLAQATKANKAVLNNILDLLTPRGGTNYMAGFRKALPLFDADVGMEEKASSGCSRAVLFLTDGTDTTDNPVLTNDIKEMNEGLTKPAIMFTYSLGTGANHDAPKQIACDGNGIWSPVLDNGNIRGQMSR